MIAVSAATTPPAKTVPTPAVTTVTPPIIAILAPNFIHLHLRFEITSLIVVFVCSFQWLANRFDISV